MEYTDQELTELIAGVDYGHLRPNVTTQGLRERRSRNLRNRVFLPGVSAAVVVAVAGGAVAMGNRGGSSGSAIASVPAAWASATSQVVGASTAPPDPYQFVGPCGEVSVTHQITPASGFVGRGLNVKVSLSVDGPRASFSYGVTGPGVPPASWFDNSGVRIQAPPVRTNSATVLLSFRPEHAGRYDVTVALHWLPTPTCTSSATSIVWLGSVSVS
jgi:hypothetical protein